VAGILFAVEVLLICFYNLEVEVQADPLSARMVQAQEQVQVLEDVEEQEQVQEQAQAQAQEQIQVLEDLEEQEQVQEADVRLLCRNSYLWDQMHCQLCRLLDSC
jgi:hypothetical protein